MGCALITVMTMEQPGRSLPVIEAALRLQMMSGMKMYRLTSSHLSQLTAWRFA